MSTTVSTEPHHTPSRVLKRPVIKAKTVCLATTDCTLKRSDVHRHAIVVEKRSEDATNDDHAICVLRKISTASIPLAGQRRSMHDSHCSRASLIKRRNKLLFDSVIDHINSSTQKVESLCRRLDASVKRLEQLEHASTPPDALSGHPESFHTTGPHNLIRLWPTVKNVLDLAGVDVDEDYVSRAEGIPGTYNAALPRQPATVNAASRPYQKSSLAVGGGPHHERSFLDVLPKADLFLAYVHHMHILHPFLDLRVVEEFPSVLQHRDGPTQLSRSIYWADSGFRRTRSGSTPLSTSTTSDQSEKGSAQAKHDAAMLLVLAIGAVCLEKVSQSSSAPPSKTNAQRERSFSVNGRDQTPYAQAEQSPMSWSQHSRPFTAPTPSHERSDSTWQWPVKYQSTACYLEAMRLLDTCEEHGDLIMVHIYLLAALYKGQFGEVYESITWLNKAGNVCRKLLIDRGLLTGAHDFCVPRSEQDLHAMQSRVREDIDDRILLASWSTIQLESDILAELPLPPSELRSHEDNIPWPNRLPDVEVYKVIESANPLSSLPGYCDIFNAYLAQLWLRKRLNHTQRWLYGNATNTLSIRALCDTLKGPINDLAGWRERLPWAFQWQDTDPPATDILRARLRAKYYGASYITHRPFLDYWLHIVPNVRNGEDLASVAVAADGTSRGSAETKIFRAVNTLPDHETWEAARQCIAAAVQSTCAFDAIVSQHRLVVTNIHGTAHA